MRNTLLALSVAAAFAAAISGPAAGKRGNAVIPPSGNGGGQWIVINGGEEEGKERLKKLLEKCGISLDFLFQNSCPDNGTGAPEPSWPEITEPETSVPESSEPETAAPEITEPETTVPETTVPESSEPEITEPETTVPETSEPENQGPSVSTEETAEPAETVHPYILRIVELVNEVRTRAGLNPVTLDPAASEAALVRAREIVRSFSHTRPDGSSFTTALKEQGVTWRLAGENIAWGQRSPEEVMEGWMNSPGHRANILRSSFTHIGVGYYQENGRNYWTQLFFQ